MRVTGSIMINRPIEQVFVYVCNFEKSPQWLPALVEVTRTNEGPIGVGTRYRRMHQLLPGWRIGGTLEITEYEPNSKLSFKANSGPVSYQGSFIFELVTHGTRFTQVMEWKPQGFFKLVEPILAATFKKKGDSYMRNESSQLKNHLEAQTEGDV